MAKDDYTKKKSFNKNGSIDSFQISGDNSANISVINSPECTVENNRNEVKITLNILYPIINGPVCFNLKNTDKNTSNKDTLSLDKLRLNKPYDTCGVPQSDTPDSEEHDVANFYDEERIAHWSDLRKKVAKLGRQKDVNIAQKLYHNMKNELSRLFDNNKGA